MILNIEHLSYRINGCLILDDINATCDVGDIIGLIGPNGAGKSTLANVLNGFILPAHGVVQFEGQNLVGLEPQKISRLGIARTFQGQHLPWNSTPRQCLFAVMTAGPGLGVRPAGHDFAGEAVPGNLNGDAESILVRFALDKVSSIPARDLSFGQQRLLALAMACIRPSKLLILDEPFAGLKSDALQLVLNVLSSEKKTKTLVIIDHTLSAVRAIASRIWFMHHGRLTVFGDYSKMACSELFRSNYLGAKAPDAPTPPVSKPQAAESPPTSDCCRRSLVLNDVSAGYGNKVIFRNANLEVLPGEVVCVIGTNGSGKSTLLRAITGLAHLFNGTVSLSGERLDSQPPDSRIRRGIRLLVQDHRLFRTLTLADNLLLSAAALHSKRERSAIPAASLSQAAKLSIASVQRMLESAGTSFSDRPAGTYSGGEQARVALAQVALGDPKLILLDEPTSGIDGMAVQSLRLAISDWQQRQIPVVIVEHALEFVASIATRVLVMAGGQLRHVDRSVHTSAQLLEEILGRP